VPFAQLCGDELVVGVRAQRAIRTGAAGFPRAARCGVAAGFKRAARSAIAARTVRRIVRIIS